MRPSRTYSWRVHSRPSTQNDFRHDTSTGRGARSCPRRRTPSAAPFLHAACFTPWVPDEILQPVLDGIPNEMWPVEGDTPQSLAARLGESTWLDYLVHDGKPVNGNPTARQPRRKTYGVEVTAEHTDADGDTVSEMFRYEAPRRKNNACWKMPMPIWHLVLFVWRAALKHLPDDGRGDDDAGASADDVGEAEPPSHSEEQVAPNHDDGGDDGGDGGDGAGGVREILGNHGKTRADEEFGFVNQSVFDEPRQPSPAVFDGDATTEEEEEEDAGESVRWRCRASPMAEGSRERADRTRGVARLPRG